MEDKLQELIEKIANNEIIADDVVLKEIETLESKIKEKKQKEQAKKRETQKAEKKEQYQKTLFEKLEQLASILEKQEKLRKQQSKELLDTIQAIKLVVPSPKVTVSPPEVNITTPEVKVPPIKVPQTKVVVPDKVSIKKPTWIGSLFTIKPIITMLEGIQKAIEKKVITLPKKASEAIPVRLSDGEKFYKALGGVATSIGNAIGFKKANNETAYPLVNENDRLSIEVNEDITEYELNDADDATEASITYIGKENKEGKWLIAKFDETGSYPIKRYASVVNNPNYENYETAFANRATLNYTFYRLVV